MITRSNVDAGEEYPDDAPWYDDTPEELREANRRGCGRFEWSVLNWNTPAIEFYEALGAKPLDEWTIYRLTGDALEKLAEAERPNWVVIMAGGHHFMETPNGDYVIAYALPETD